MWPFKKSEKLQEFGYFEFGENTCENMMDKISVDTLISGNQILKNGIVITVTPDIILDIKENGINEYSVIRLTHDVLLKSGFKHERWKAFSENLNKNIDDATGYIFEEYFGSVYCFSCWTEYRSSFGRRNTRSWNSGNKDRWNFESYAEIYTLHSLQNVAKYCAGRTIIYTP